MSPHGIAGPHNQGTPNLGKKCPLSGPLTMQNIVAIRQEVSEISAIENLCFPKKWTKVHQIFFLGMLLTEVPNQPKFCHNRLKKFGRYPRSKKWAKIYQNRLSCYPLKPHIMPNFIKIGETTLEKSVTNFFTPFNILAPVRDPLGQSYRSGWWGIPTPL